MSWTRRLSDYLDANAAARGGAEALVTERARLTHAALRAEVRRLARAMLALGIRRGERVALLLPNDEAWVALFFAAASIGAVTVPLNTRWKAPEIAFALRRAQCVAVFAAPAFLSQDFRALLLEAEPAVATGLPGAALPSLRAAVFTAGEPPAGAIGWEAFRALDAGEAALESAAAAVTAEDDLLVQFTSGTTAHPKGVLLTHHNMLRNAAACAERLGVRAEDRYLNCRPFFHVAGSTLSLLVCMVTGATLVTPPTFEAGAALRLLEAERCTLTSGNDAIFQLLLAHPAFGRARLHLRGGWAAAGPETMRRIAEELGMREVCWAYGLSEASPNVAMSDHREPLEARIAGGAHPHPGIAVRIAPDGEIQLKGWSVMKGYVGDEAATAAAFTPDGWLRTGDLGSIGPDGRLRLAGRLKDVIRVGGENMAPAEVEEVLSTHPAVALAQVVGVPDARLGEVPVAFVQLRDGAAATAEELLAWLKPKVAGFRLPRRLWFVPGFESIGMTASGKVQKARLREHARALIGGG
ncbi:MAG: AMP-binding protein [Acetobacteraceae bacterium]|nr:AMP-binding protein [Acetobacteraceae bacterium]MDW8398515.1 AMP-binding protein [Acetobacteraceae bacterium]